MVILRSALLIKHVICYVPFGKSSNNQMWNPATLGLDLMRKHFSISCLILLSFCYIIHASLAMSAGYTIPFQGMRLVYYTQTTQALLQQTGLSGQGWVTLTFHDLSVNSSKMDVNVNATVTEVGRSLPDVVNATTDFPTNTDTLIFLRHGGQEKIDLYAGAAGQAIQVIPGFSLQLSRSWNLYDQTVAVTPVGNFSVYRYHTSLGSGSTTLDLFASYDKSTQLLVYLEGYATQGGLSILVEKLELRETNVQFSSQTLSSQSGIATLTCDGGLSGPVQLACRFTELKF